MKGIKETLSEREETHGIYRNTANAYAGIKKTYEACWMPDEINPVYPERRHGSMDLDDNRLMTLDCIAMKLARILSGDSRCVDHWRDIAGYATLQAQELEEVVKNPPRPGCTDSKEGENGGDD